jgi:hypothetical protein
MVAQVTFHACILSFTAESRYQPGGEEPEQPARRHGTTYLPSTAISLMSIFMRVNTPLEIDSAHCHLTPLTSTSVDCVHPPQSAQFGSTTQMFKSTIGKLGVMLNTGGSNHMFYLIFFVVFVFLVLYYLMSRK